MGLGGGFRGEHFPCLLSKAHFLLLLLSSGQVHRHEHERQEALKESPPFLYTSFSRMWPRRSIGQSVRLNPTEIVVMATINVALKFCKRSIANPDRTSCCWSKLLINMRPQSFVSSPSLLCVVCNACNIHTLGKSGEVRNQETFAIYYVCLSALICGLQ